MGELEKIRACSSAFDEALKVGDGDTCASLYVQDGTLMPPNSRLVQGHDAIRKHFTDLGPDSSMGGDISKTEISGNLAYQNTRVSWESDGQSKYTDCLDILQKQDDGSWLYVLSTWNSEEGLNQD